MPRVVAEFIDFRPAFLEVIIDRDAGVYPMVGPGQSEEMITGDHIASRTKAEPREPDESEMF